MCPLRVGPFYTLVEWPLFPWALSRFSLNHALQDLIATMEDEIPAEQRKERVDKLRGEMIRELKVAKALRAMASRARTAAAD